MANIDILTIIKFCKTASERSFKRMNPYGLKGRNQDILVEQLCAQFEKTILRPLHRETEQETVQADLKEVLDEYQKQFVILFEENSRGVLIDRHNALLEKRGFSALSAIIEAHDPERVKVIFEDIVRVENASASGDESKMIKLSWLEYFDIAYNEFWRELKKLLPEGPHAVFYTKRVSKKKQQIPEAEDIQRRGQRRKDSSKEATKSPSPQKKNDPSRPNLSRSLGSNEKEGLTKSVEEKENSTSVQHKVVSRPTPAPRPKPKTDRPPVMMTGANISDPHEHSVNSSKHELIVTEEKRTDLPKNAPTEGQEAVEIVGPPKPDPPKPTIEPPKPKKNLLEQMQELSKSKIEKEKEKQKEISYPPIFKQKNWKKYWSNTKAIKGSVWNEFFWNCNSIGKSYLMEMKEREQLKREHDVNQDFAVVNPSQDTLRTILFDGVSQSRAPRQWAECLAETYVNNKLNISKLQSHSKDLEKWHKASRKKWDTWIEEHYIPQRQHLPEWRLKNEKNLSFTTFLSIEIDRKSVKIANIGDSAVFCRFISGEIKHLPATYNHLLRPKNISTIELYKPDEIEFYTFEVDSLESLLACTDSIADYIFDEDPKRMSDKYDECLRELSTKGDKFEFISKMIAKGPSRGGWLEDDVTFFTLVRNERDSFIDESLKEIPLERHGTGCESE